MQAGLLIKMKEHNAQMLLYGFLKGLCFFTKGHT
jgi:hypothetical protein